MRLLFRGCWLLGLAGSAFVLRGADAVLPPAHATIPPPLADALAKLPQDFDHWAYTETRRFTDLKGRVKETITRFDPSKPYAEQFTPIKINNLEPTKKQLEEYRKRGERRGKRLEQEDGEGKIPAAQTPSLNINGSTLPVDLEHAILHTDGPAGQLLYEIPLKSDPKSPVPIEKFQLFARLNAENHALENVSLKLRESFRVKLIANIKSGEASIDFTSIDPKFNPFPTSLTGDGRVSFFFIPLGGQFEIKRTDFQRVKPYHEKFGVKIGPLKALDF
jgi:hypothetical protein